MELGGRNDAHGFARALGWLTALAVLALAGPTGAVAADYIDETLPVDVRSGGEFPHDGKSEGVLDISDDGRYILFRSSSRELTEDDYPQSPHGAPIWHQFRRDMWTGEVELVDVNADGRVAKVGAPTGASMSADGNEIVFRAPGSELGPEPLPDEIYARDMTTGALDLVNRADGSNGRIIHLLGGSLSISADGTKVAFLSYESDVDPDVEVAPDPEILHAYVRDLETGSTELVDCIDGDPCAPAPGGVSNDGIDMSADGRYVLIHRADAPGGACIDRPELDYACTQFYVRDMVSRTTTLASRADGVDGPPANSYVSTAYLSDDGRHVAFDTAATNLEPELPANTPWLSYEWTYVRDLDGATTTLVSRADGADGHAADTGAHANGISADGSKVMFGAFDDSLAGFPKDAGFEAFVRDVEDSRTELVSRRDGGFGLPAATATDGTSTGWGDISAGGDFVVFSSSDLSLTGDPDPEESHVFRRQITGDPAPPEVGEKVQLAPEEGPVVVKIPDSPFFEQLERGTQVPTGSIIDATDGALEIRSEIAVSRASPNATWSGPAAEFVTDQAELRRGPDPVDPLGTAARLRHARSPHPRRSQAVQRATSRRDPDSGPQALGPRRQGTPEQGREVLGQRPRDRVAGLGHLRRRDGHLRGRGPGRGRGRRPRANRLRRPRRALRRARAA